MASIIRQVGDAIVGVLSTEIGGTVQLDTEEDLKSDSTNRISVLLYRVTENPADEKPAPHPGCGESVPAGAARIGSPLPHRASF